jgi:[ribosomal protein S5]-alanine N-acetyltransferase
MKEQPALKTERLLLRPFTLADAPDVLRLAGDRDIASTTLNIPHPYEPGMAEAWISTHPDAFDRGETVTFALARRADKTLIGAIGLRLEPEHRLAELGYWVGKPYWNQGFATEAARAVIGYGFEELGLNRIYASHLARNPASGRVMQKAGLVYEGRLRQRILKWGVFEDLEIYAILRSDYDNSIKRPAEPQKGE